MRALGGDDQLNTNNTQDSGRSPQPCPLSFKLLPLTFTRGCPPGRGAVEAEIMEA